MANSMVLVSVTITGAPLNDINKSRVHVLLPRDPSHPMSILMKAFGSPPAPSPPEKLRVIKHRHVTTNEPRYSPCAHHRVQRLVASVLRMTTMRCRVSRDGGRRAIHFRARRKHREIGIPRIALGRRHGKEGYCCLRPRFFARRNVRSPLPARPPFPVLAQSWGS